MKDPEFAKELKKLQDNPMYQSAMQQATALYNDPQKAAEIMVIKL